MKKRILQILAGGLLLLFAAGTALAEAGVGETTFEPVEKYGMLPVYGRDVQDGVYAVEARSSSSMFRIVEAELTVKQGEMSAVITLSGQGYGKLFAGTAEEAVQADEADYIAYAEDEEGRYTYEVPVEALNAPLDIAAFSTRKELWYDRKVLFDAGTLPEEALLLELPDYDLIEAAVGAYAGDAEETADAEAVRAEDSTIGENPSDPVAIDLKDGEYAIEVAMTGGSGKASVSSPTIFIVREGRAYARLEWSSSNYDYMVVGGQKYLNENTDGGNSVFEIPVTKLDSAITVLADTTAMGTPHEIEYLVTFYSESIGPKSQLPREAAKRVVYIALAIIVGGGILNYWLKKRRAM